MDFVSELNLTMMTEKKGIIIFNALCRVFVAIAQTELESCCKNVKLSD